MVAQNWIMNCLKRYKTSDEIIHFIEKKHDNLESGIGSKRKKLKNQRRKFQADAQSPLSIIAMLPLNHILKKCTAGYKLGKSQEKINPLMHMDKIKLFMTKKKNSKL